MRKDKKDFVIAFDFDGTLTTDESKWPMIGQPNREMIKLVNFLYDHGFLITINSLRGEDDREVFANMLKFLNDNKVGFDYVNESPPHHIEAFGGKPKGDPRKVSASIYVDDRNAGGLASCKTIVQDVVSGYTKRIKAGYCMWNDEIDEQFIDQCVVRYIAPIGGIKTTLRRTIREEE